MTEPSFIRISYVRGGDGGDHPVTPGREGRVVRDETLNVDDCVSVNPANPEVGIIRFMRYGGGKWIQVTPTPERTTRRMLKEAEAWADNLPAPRDLDALHREWRAKREAEGAGEPLRLKLFGDPTMQPGDIAVFDHQSDGPSCGHVEIVRSRRSGKRSMLARLRKRFGA
jgi:hypothetical protein